MTRKQVAARKRAHKRCVAIVSGKRTPATDLRNYVFFMAGVRQGRREANSRRT